MPDGSLDARDADPVDAGGDLRPDAGPDGGALPPAVTPPPVSEPPLPAVCAPPAAPRFDGAVLETRWPDAGGVDVYRDAVHVVMTPLVIDLEPDASGRVEPQIVFTSYAVADEPGILRIWDPRSGETQSYPPDGEALGVLEFSGNLAAGDIDGDGGNEIVGIGPRYGTVAFDGDGSLLWRSDDPNGLERGVVTPTTAGAPVLADLEGDGTVEVVVGRTVLEGADGTLRWNGVRGEVTRGVNRAVVGPTSCVADLDGDGRLEVIAGPTAFAADGRVLWTKVGEILDGSCAVGDVLPDVGGLEVLIMSRGYLWVLDGRTGERHWVRELEGSLSRNPYGGAPTVADFDGDGRAEFAAAGGIFYTVFDPECLGPGEPAGCSAEGLLWSAPTEDVSSAATGSSVFDFNGDGRAEVVYNDEYFFRVYDGRSGDVLFEHPNSSRTRTEYPVVADADADGHAEIVFSASSEAAFLNPRRRTDAGVEIWGDRLDRWVGARRIWNQHAFVPGFVAEDGTILSDPGDPWASLNAFRQNVGDDYDPPTAPDLWGGRGTYRCDPSGPGRAVLSIDVHNVGLEPVPPSVVVGVYRSSVAPVNRVATLTTAAAIGPGDSERLELPVRLGADADESWIAVLDDPRSPGGGVVVECLEDNNEVLVWRPTCPER